MDFWRAAHILARRKWLILLSVVVATTATWGLLHLIGGRWLATIRFVSPQTSSLAGAGNGAEGEAPLAEGRPEAEQAAKAQATLGAAMIQSRVVMEPALQQIGATARDADRGGGITFRAVRP